MTNLLFQNFCLKLLKIYRRRKNTFLSLPHIFNYQKISNQLKSPKKMELKESLRMDFFFNVNKAYRL